MISLPPPVFGTLQQGKLIRTLKGHGHWVNTLALSPEHALRTGAFDHTGSAPQDPDTARQVHASCTMPVGAILYIPQHLQCNTDTLQVLLHTAAVDHWAPLTACTCLAGSAAAVPGGDGRAARAPGVGV